MEFEAHSARFDHSLYGSLPLRKLRACCLKLNQYNGVLRELDTINRCAQESEVVWIIWIGFQERHELLGQLAVANRLRAFLFVEFCNGDRFLCKLLPRVA